MRALNRPFLANVFVILLLFLSSESSLFFLQRHNSGEIDQVAGNPFSSAVWTVFYLIILYLMLFFHRKESIRVAKQSRLLIILLVVAFVSILWSDVPGVTLRRIIAILGSMLASLYIAVNYKPQQLVILLGWVFGLTVFIGFVSVIMFPADCIHRDIHYGSWRGIYSHKNLFGQVMVLAMLSFVTLYFMSSRGSRRALFACLIALTGFLAFKSQSTTCFILILSIVAGFLGIFIFIKRINSVGMLLSFILLVVLISLMLLHELGISIDTVDIFLSKYFQKNLTLTGRTFLWNLLWLDIQNSPWIGYGYGGYWLGSKGLSGGVLLLLNWAPNTGHNGFIDLALNLGALGVALFVIVSIQYIIRSIILFKNEIGKERYFPLLFLLFYIMVNISYSSILKHNDLHWILFCAIFFQLSDYSKSNLVKYNDAKVNN